MQKIYKLKNVLLEADQIVYNDYTILATSERAIAFSFFDESYLFIAKKDHNKFYTFYIYKGEFNSVSGEFSIEEIIYKSFKVAFKDYNVFYRNFSDTIASIFSLDVRDIGFLSTILIGRYPSTHIVSIPNLDNKVLQ